MPSVPTRNVFVPNVVGTEQDRYFIHAQGTNSLPEPHVSQGFVPKMDYRCKINGCNSFLCIAADEHLESRNKAPCAKLSSLLGFRDSREGTWTSPGFSTTCPSTNGCRWRRSAPLIPTGKPFSRSS